MAVRPSKAKIAYIRWFDSSIKRGEAIKPHSTSADGPDSGHHAMWL